MGPNIRQLRRQIRRDLDRLKRLEKTENAYSEARRFLRYLMGEIRERQDEVCRARLVQRLRGGSTHKEAELATHPVKNLQAQLMGDLERFGVLMGRYAMGERSVKAERDQLEGAVEIKLAILEGLKRNAPLEEALEDAEWDWGGAD